MSVLGISGRMPKPDVAAAQRGGYRYSEPMPWRAWRKHKTDHGLFYLCDSSAHQRTVAIASHVSRVSSLRSPHL